MKLASFATIVLLCALCSAQVGPTIKGHRLGESAAAYVAATSGGDDQVARCEQAAMANKKEFKRLHVDRSQCSTLLSGIHNGARIELHNPPLHATVDGGVVVKLVIDIGEPLGRDAAGVLYEDALSDAIKKFGTPTKQDTNVLENGFGATFPHRIAWWEMPQYTVLLYEGENTVYRHWSTLTITAASEEKRKNDNHHSALD